MDKEIPKDIDPSFSTLQHHKENEKSLLKLRCPNCFKLYSVPIESLGGPRSYFCCLDCETYFWIPYPNCLNYSQGLIGYPVEKENLPQDQFHFCHLLESQPFRCPKCQKPYATSQKECTSCGLIFKKYHFRSFVSKANPELTSLWNQLFQNYDKNDLHDKFILSCFKMKCLSYAIGKYGRFLQANPSDKKTKQAFKKISALSEINLQNETSFWHRLDLLPVKKQDPFFTLLNFFLISCSMSALFLGAYLPNKEVFICGLVCLFVGLFLRKRFWV